MVLELVVVTIRGQKKTAIFSFRPKIPVLVIKNSEGNLFFNSGSMALAG